MNYEVSMYLNGPNYSFYHPRSVGYAKLISISTYSQASIEKSLRKSEFRDFKFEVYARL